MIYVKSETCAQWDQLLLTLFDWTFNFKQFDVDC